MNHLTLPYSDSLLLFERMRDLPHPVRFCTAAIVRPIRDATTVDAWSALTAAFPGGSVTGAPKIRAMQIINELEPVARSVYCGSIGYVDSTGAMDTNIAIRTLAFTPTGVHCWGGGAVVADSSAADELPEIDHKIGRLLQTVASLGASKSCRA